MDEDDDFNKPDEDEIIEETEYETPYVAEEEKEIADKKDKPSQDDLIANEEREIKKIIEEGEKAAAAVPEKHEEEKPAEQPKGDGGWKWFFVGLGIILLIGLTFYGFKYMSAPKLEDLQNAGPLAQFGPAEFLDGWDLKSSYLSLADLPIDRKKEFLNENNLTDVATWEFAKGDDTVYVWVRKFSDEAAAKIGAGSFSPTAWRNVGQSALSFGEEGKIGIYRITGNDPLLAYVWQGDTILSVAYYNTNNKQYDATNLMEDKVFLTKLTKNIMTKIVSAEGRALKVAEIKN